MEVKQHDDSAPPQMSALIASVRTRLSAAFENDLEILRLVEDHSIEECDGILALIDHISTILSQVETNCEKAEWIADADVMDRAIVMMALDELKEGIRDLPRDTRLTVVKRFQQTLDDEAHKSAGVASSPVDVSKADEVTTPNAGADLIDCSISDTAEKALTTPVLRLAGSQADAVPADGTGTTAQDTSITLANCRYLLICIAMTIVSVYLLQQMPK
ncbi:hypothetical protein LTR95_004118 [Oleoguttula sp. CCFEE 5521]